MLSNTLELALHHPSLGTAEAASSVAVGAISALAAGATAWFAYRLNRVTERQAMIAEAQANIARQQLELERGDAERERRRLWSEAKNSAQAALAAYATAYHKLEMATQIDQGNEAYLGFDGVLNQGEMHLYEVRRLITERDGEPSRAVTLAVRDAEEARGLLTRLLTGWQRLNAERPPAEKHVLTGDCQRLAGYAVTHLALEFGLPQPGGIPQQVSEF